MKHPASPLPSWRRALLALTAGLGLALGTAAPHDPLAEGPGIPAGVEIAEDAVHPDAPAHVESSRAEVHPPCQACLIQIHTQSLQPRPAADLQRPDDAASVEIPFETGASVAVPRLGPARAPPPLLS